MQYHFLREVRKEPGDKGYDSRIVGPYIGWTQDDAAKARRSVARGYKAVPFTVESEHTLWRTFMYSTLDCHEVTSGVLNDFLAYMRTRFNADPFARRITTTGILEVSLEPSSFAVRELAPSTGKYKEMAKSSIVRELYRELHRRLGIRALDTRVERTERIIKATGSQVFKGRLEEAVRSPAVLF